MPSPARLQDFVASWWRRHRATLVLVTDDVEEAVFFAHQVVILAGPPGRIKRRFAVELPDERQREDRRLLRWLSVRFATTAAEMVVTDEGRRNNRRVEFRIDDALEK